MLLAIDIGNTDIKFGVKDGNEWRAVWRRPTSDRSSTSRWLKDCLAGASLSAKAVDAVMAASVVPPANERINQACNTLFHVEPEFLKFEKDGGAAYHGLKISYDPPQSLGVDRLANVIGALEGFQAPLIVIDFGSATTLDVVEGYAFIGGAILPGMRLQAKCLGRGTSQLPEISLDVPPHAVGRSTLEAIQSGIVLGHVSAVEGLVARIAKELAEPPTVIATGGLSHFLIGATETIHHFVPNLTLEGIAAVWRRKSYQPSGSR